MGFAAGEVLQGCAEGVGGDQANVHLHFAAHAKADLVFAASDDVHQARQLDDVVNQLLTFFLITAMPPGYEDIEIADCPASSAERSGGGDFFSAGIIAQ